MSIRMIIDDLKAKRERAGLGTLSLGTYGLNFGPIGSSADIVSDTPIPGSRCGDKMEPAYGGHLVGEGMTAAVALYMASLHNQFPALAEATLRGGDHDSPMGLTCEMLFEAMGSEAVMMDWPLEKLAAAACNHLKRKPTLEEWNTANQAIQDATNQIQAFRETVGADPSLNLQGVAEAILLERNQSKAKLKDSGRWETGFRNIVTTVLGARQTWVIEDIVSIVETLEENSRTFIGPDGLSIRLGSAQEVMQRRQECARRLVELEARVREMEAERDGWSVRSCELLKDLKAAQERLAAIDAARDGEPPVPEMQEGRPVADYLAWGHQAWDARAEERRLRLEAETQARELATEIGWLHEQNAMGEKLLGETNQRVSALEGSLAVIDAAKVGLPPEPKLAEFTGKTEEWQHVLDLRTWGNQLVTIIKDLQVKLQEQRGPFGPALDQAETTGHEKGVMQERERLCRTFTSYPFNLSEYSPSSTESVSLTFETAMRRAAKGTEGEQ